ncbi:Abi family protein [Proteinivorax tanatarense]|uniref:Abi family protein n=1 Tax=Proteinivorax tanatarense TaxID=1260629 RepID=A0AAU7VH85_9FIRM
MRKEKLGIQEQIEHMNSKGVMFNIIDEDEAKHFLKYNNYYFKLKSYAKNYNKYFEEENEKYANLEFAYLMELSKIDMYFRRFIIKMTLDIEHFLKTQLLRDFEQNDKENGYDIIDELFSKHDYIKDNISRQDKNSTCSDLIQKYKDDFAIWNIVEALSFGDFTKLYRIYYQKYPTKGSMERFLWSVRYIRNASAHNSCLLNSLKVPYSKTIRPNQQITKFLSEIGISRKSRRNKMVNPVIHDFVVSLYVFNSVASESVKENTMRELKELMDDRVTYKKEYFEKNQFIKSYYNFLKTIVDYYYDLSV